MKTLAERNPDAMVTLSARVNEQETDMKADIEVSTRFEMRVCQDQISRNKYFAHVLPIWSRLMQMNSVQVVIFGRFGYPDKGPMRMPSHKQHAARETDVKMQDRSSWPTVLCAQAIDRTGRSPIGIKWVDVKKADGRHRSRLVAKELKQRNRP